MSSIAVFVISLKRSQDRRDYIAAQLQAQSIEFSFFDAIDGADKSNPLLKRYNYKKRLWLTSGKMPTHGEIGCYASHYSLWQKCVDLNQPILVIEDDAHICSNAKEIKNIVTTKIQQYGFLRLESVIRGETTLIENNDKYQISHMSDNFGGTRAYAIAPSSAYQLLNSSKSWSMPVDNYIGKAYIHGMESYHLNPNFAEVTNSFDSTIQINDKITTPLYRKLSRELYTTYSQIRHYLHYRKTKKCLLYKG